MHNHTRRASRRVLLILAALAAAAAIAATDQPAQPRQPRQPGQPRQSGGRGAGRSLDANLLAGSNGYNRPNRGGGGGAMMGKQRYTAGSSKPLYTVNRNGDMVYNTTNAFNPRSAYTATGYTGNYTSQASFSRFRYQGQY